MIFKRIDFVVYCVPGMSALRATLTKIGVNNLLLLLLFSLVSAVQSIELSINLNCSIDIDYETEK